MDVELDPLRPTLTGAERPKPSGRLCARRGCGSVINPVLRPGQRFHPNCEPGMRFAGGQKPGTDHPYRELIINAILDHDASRARSQQVELGPSELGATCDRLLAYKLNAFPEINRFNDPWPAIVGTALHAHLELVLHHYNQTHGQRFLTERKVFVDPMVKGTADAYDMVEHRVLDWKSMGKTKENELDSQGPPIGYITQIQLYGLGYAMAGYRVDTVGLFFVPRAGFLKKSARYYEWPFNEAMAREAISRLYRIGGAIAPWVMAGEDRWSEVPADPGKNCGYCPFYSRPSDSGAVATAGRCPGR